MACASAPNTQRKTTRIEAALQHKTPSLLSTVQLHLRNGAVDAEVVQELQWCRDTAVTAQQLSAYPSSPVVSVPSPYLSHVLVSHPPCAVSHHLCLAHLWCVCPARHPSPAVDVNTPCIKHLVPLCAKPWPLEQRRSCTATALRDAEHSLAHFNIWSSLPRSAGLGMLILKYMQKLSEWSIDVESGCVRCSRDTAVSWLLVCIELSYKTNQSLGAELAEKRDPSSDPVLSGHIGSERHSDDIIGGVAGGGQGATPLTGLVDGHHVTHPLGDVLSLNGLQPHLTEREREERRGA
ncbi:hypothetical protein INR49_006454, partial [Caranx melampygus]